MRSSGGAISSVLQLAGADDEQGQDRVLRAGFWLASSPKGTGNVIALDAFRARREQARK